MNVTFETRRWDDNAKRLIINLRLREMFCFDYWSETVGARVWNSASRLKANRSILGTFNHRYVSAYRALNPQRVQFSSGRRDCQTLCGIACKVMWNLTNVRSTREWWNRLEETSNRCWAEIIIFGCSSTKANDECERSSMSMDNKGFWLRPSRFICSVFAYAKANRSLSCERPRLLDNCTMHSR